MMRYFLINASVTDSYGTGIVNIHFVSERFPNMKALECKIISNATAKPSNKFYEWVLLSVIELSEADFQDWTG